MPEGWLNLYNVSIVLGISRSKASKLIHKFEIESKQFRMNSGQVQNFYSPEDVERLRKHINA